MCCLVRLLHWSDAKRSIHSGCISRCDSCLLSISFSSAINSLSLLANAYFKLAMMIVWETHVISSLVHIQIVAAQWRRFAARQQTTPVWQGHQQPDNSQNEASAAPAAAGASCPASQQPSSPRLRMPLQPRHASANSWQNADEANKSVNASAAKVLSSPTRGKTTVPVAPGATFGGKRYQGHSSAERSKNPDAEAWWEPRWP